MRRIISTVFIAASQFLAGAAEFGKTESLGLKRNESSVSDLEYPDFPQIASWGFTDYREVWAMNSVVLSDPTPPALQNLPSIYSKEIMAQVVDAVREKKEDFRSKPVNFTEVLEELIEEIDLKRAEDFHSSGYLCYEKDGGRNLRTAIEYYTKSLEIKKKVYGEEHIEIAFELNSLGQAYYNLYDKASLQKATKFFRMAHELWVKLVGNEDPTSEVLGDYHKRAAKALEEAIEKQKLIKQCLKTKRKPVSRLKEMFKKYRDPKDQTMPSAERVLRRAAKAGNAADVKVLVSMVCDGDAQDNDLKSRRTALHWAVIKGHVEAAKVLINGGARSDISDASGQTAEDYADSSTFEAIKALFPSVCVNHSLSI